MTGLQILLPRVKSFGARGGSLKVLTSTYMDVTEPQALRSLLCLPNVETRLITPVDAGFHSKAYIFAGKAGRQRTWVGSSNLTKGGISTNLEWNLSSDASEIAEEARAHFDSLWESEVTHPLTKATIDAYERVRRERLLSGGTPASDEPMPVLRAAEIAPELLSPNEVQLEALGALARARAGGAKRALVIAATGIGKTYLAAFDAQAVHAKRILFIAHRKDILVQAEATFRKVFGFSRNEACLLFEGESPGDQPHVFATVATLARLIDRGHPLAHAAFDYVVVDEFHHADASSWRKVLGVIKGDFLLGLTATPERADGREILELCDFNVAYEVRLPEAIQRGVLIPFHYFGIPDEGVTEDRIPWRNGRFDPEALEAELKLPERVENLIRQAEEKGFDGRKRVALGFCQSIKHAEYLATEFRTRGIEAVALDGEHDLSVREAVYGRLQDPDDPLQWLFVVDLLNEGVDLPAVNVVAMLRPTESLPLFLQQVGRGLRKYPGTDALTILDFVGSHRKAFLPLQALSSPADVLANPDSTARQLSIAAPPFCEFLLEDRTIEILTTIKARTTTRKERVKEAYERLRAELKRPPRPIDFWGDPELPSFAEVRNAFGSWRSLRVAMRDAISWENELVVGSPLELLLKAAESNWQESRVTSYAALWAACAQEGLSVAGYDRFFVDHPQWSVERLESVAVKVLGDRLSKNLPPDCWTGTDFTAPVLGAIPREELETAIRERLRPTLAEDFRIRHAGVLREPNALALFSTYSRPEIINHFGVQYDPARHNDGFMQVSPKKFIIIAKLDTSGAKEAFQYRNQLMSDLRQFQWSSQNRQHPENETGKDVLEHESRGNQLYLFVQPRSHAKAAFLGRVKVISAKGGRPMQVTFQLPTQVPPHIAREVGLAET